MPAFIYSGKKLISDIGYPISEWEGLMGVNYLHACKGSENCHAANHLCQIVARRDMGEVKELIKEPMYYCKNCGRAAHNKGNLCNPSAL